MHKKGLKFALILELAQLKFTYITEVKVLALVMEVSIETSML